MSNAIDIHLVAAKNANGDLEKLTYRATNSAGSEYFISDDLDFMEFGERNFDRTFERLARDYPLVRELFVSVSADAVREFVAETLFEGIPDSRDELFIVIEALKSNPHWGILVPGVLVADVRA